MACWVSVGPWHAHRPNNPDRARTWTSFSVHGVTRESSNSNHASPAPLGLGRTVYAVSVRAAAAAAARATAWGCQPAPSATHQASHLCPGHRNFFWRAGAATHSGPASGCRSGSDVGPAWSLVPSDRKCSERHTGRVTLLGYVQHARIPTLRKGRKSRLPPGPPSAPPADSWSGQTRWDARAREGVAPTEQTCAYKQVPGKCLGPSGARAGGWVPGRTAAET